MDLECGASAVTGLGLVSGAQLVAITSATSARGSIRISVLRPLGASQTERVTDHGIELAASLRLVTLEFWPVTVENGSAATVLL